MKNMKFLQLFILVVIVQLMTGCTPMVYMSIIATEAFEKSIDDALSAPFRVIEGRDYKVTNKKLDESIRNLETWPVQMGNAAPPFMELVVGAYARLAALGPAGWPSEERSLPSCEALKRGDCLRYYNARTPHREACLAELEYDIRSCQRERDAKTANLAINGCQKIIVLRNSQQFKKRDTKKGTCFIEYGFAGRNDRPWRLEISFYHPAPYLYPNDITILARLDFETSERGFKFKEGENAVRMVWDETSYPDRQKVKPAAAVKLMEELTAYAAAAKSAGAKSAAAKKTKPALPKYSDR